MADSVKIKVTGDDGQYRKVLSGLETATKTALKGLTVAGAAVSAAWGAIGAVGVKYNAEIEQLQTSFEVMTGSATKAADVTERLRDIGASTPFDLKGLASTTQLLMNYGFEADRAVDEMMMLGDIAQGNAEAMNSIAMGYAQMSSLGKVNLQDIKQMINGGFNPLQEISERTGESMEKLYDRISKGKMSVSEITESMKHATAEGGKYYQSMEKQAQTFQGRLDTLKEDATAFTGQIMASVSDSLRDTVIPMASDMLAEFSDAFSAGGFDGLIDAVTAKIPELLDKAIAVIKQGTSGLSKWLPGAVKQIATVIPSAVRAIVDLSPQIVQSLFEVASSLVSDLITMLPELIPMILDGAAKMLRSVTVGLGKLIEGVFDGLDDLMIDVGMKRASIDKAINRMFANYDAEEVKELKQVWNATITTNITVDDYQKKINEAIAAIQTALKGVKGLKDEDKAAIELAIANGTGIPILQSALEGLKVDPKTAEAVTATITSAMGTINTTLEGLGLSDDAIKAIAKVAIEGGDVQAELVKYGVSPDVAKDTAATITDGMGEINTAVDGLGLDPIAKATVLAGVMGDKASIISMLTMLGVPSDVLDTVAASYDTVSGTLTGKLTAAINSAYAALTDGETDTPKVMAEIKGEIEKAYKDAVDAINKWIADEIAKLDPTSTDYQSKVDSIQKTGEDSIKQVTGYQSAMWLIVGGLADASQEKVDETWTKVEELLGKTQETVKAYEDLEGRVNKQNETNITLTKQGSVRESNKEVGVSAFSATAQQNDAERAALLKKYEDAKQQLADAFASNGDKEAYDNGIAALEEEFAQKNAERIEAYRAKMSELLQGLLTSLEQTNPELAAALKKFLNPEQTMTEVQGAMDAWSAGELDASKMTDAVVKALNESTGFDWSAEDYLKLGNEDLGTKIQGALDAEVAKLETALDEAPPDLGFVSDILNTALQEGAFNDFSADGINTDNMNEALKAVGTTAGAKIPEGISSNKDAAKTAGAEVASAGAEGADKSDEFEKSGENSGQGWLDGFREKAVQMVIAAYNAGKAVHKAFARGQEEGSPAKSFIRSGRYSGQGWEIGFKESMGKAVKTARELSGNLVGAANMPVRFAMPNISEIITDVMAGSDAQATPVYLDSKQIASIQRNNNNVAITRHNRRVVMGYGGR